MLKFLADHCISNFVLQTLQNEGHEVLRLRDYIPPDSPDEAVISQAQEINALLISLNGDFADIVTYPPANYKGIITLQLRNHPEATPQLMSRLIGYLTAHPDSDHFVGKLLLVEAHRIRIRQ